MQAGFWFADSWGRGGRKGGRFIFEPVWFDPVTDGRFDVLIGLHADGGVEVEVLYCCVLIERMDSRAGCKKMIYQPTGTTWCNDEFWSGTSRATKVMNIPEPLETPPSPLCIVVFVCLCDGFANVMKRKHQGCRRPNGGPRNTKKSTTKHWNRNRQIGTSCRCVAWPVRLTVYLSR